MISTLTEQPSAGQEMAPLFPKEEIEKRPAPEARTERMDAAKLRGLAKELMDSMANALDKYVAVCEHIRAAQIMPVTVRKELSAVGFAASRISEIIRVSQVSNEVWAQYKSRAIGFKVTLDLARGEVAKIEAEKKAAEAGRNPELFNASEMPPAALPAAAPESPAEAKETAQEAKPDDEPAIWKKWDKNKAHVRERPAKIEKTKAVKPVKPSPESVNVELRESIGNTSAIVSVYIPPDARKLTSGVNPVNIFDVNGWKVEVRITRAKQTKKASKKPATKTKKDKK